MCNRPEMVVLEEKCRGLLFNDDLLLCLSLGLLDLSAAHRPLFTRKRDAVREKNVVELLSLRSTNDSLRWLFSLLLLLSVLFVGGSGIIFVLNAQKSNKIYKKHKQTDIQALRQFNETYLLRFFFII